jgi:2-keto-4-pentenoate hydratase/2-oxohepta-3-ene-1,7-dioic acid hydratase in catechol pathway
MRLARFRTSQGQVLAGRIDQDRVIEIGPDANGDSLLAYLLESRLGRQMSSGPSYALGDVHLLPPLKRPPKIIGIGLNYESHRQEVEAAKPEEPTVFAKFNSSIVGPNDPIDLPAAAPRRVDYEAELAVVLSGGGRDIAESNAMRHVAGYMAANDVSARDWQTKKPNGQWVLGKSFDTFLPLGPALVSVEEVPNPHDLAVSCTVSGAVRQQARTSELIFSIPELIAYLSRVCTLEAGDVILTGTPAGVGMARKPPAWLQDGDVVETYVELVGTLRNRVRGAQEQSVLASREVLSGD